MAGKPNPISVQLVDLLRAGPTTIPQLAASVGIDPASDDFRKATKHKAFTAHVVLVQKKNPESLVALVEDLGRLVESETLLLTLLEQTCTPEAPTIALDKLTKKIDKPLQQAFADALARRIQEGRLPDAAATIDVKAKPHLYLKRMPPKRPADVELVEALLQALQRRDIDWTMRTLRETVVADDKLWKKALGSKQLKPRLLIAAKGDDAPLALVEDADRLAGSPVLLAFALTACRSNDNQAASVADLKKKVAKPLQEPFERALKQRVQERSMPTGIGALWIKKQPSFFFWTDAAGQAGKEEQPAPAIDFGSAFDQAFDALNRRQGLVNLVSLVDLRRAVPVDRETFDQQLHELRRAGRYSLTGAEGRHGLTAEELEAGIPEGQGLLLFVSRR